MASSSLLVFGSWRVPLTLYGCLFLLGYGSFFSLGYVSPWLAGPSIGVWQSLLFGVWQFLLFLGMVDVVRDFCFPFSLSPFQVSLVFLRGGSGLP